MWRRQGWSRLEWFPLGEMERELPDRFRPERFVWQLQWDNVRIFAVQRECNEHILIWSARLQELTTHTTSSYCKISFVQRQFLMSASWQPALLKIVIVQFTLAVCQLISEYGVAVKYSRSRAEAVTVLWHSSLARWLPPKRMQRKGRKAEPSQIPDWGDTGDLPAQN
jgi:hypothetical protein